MQIFSEYAVMLIVMGSVNLETSLDAVLGFLILYIFNLLLIKIFKDEYKVKLILSIFICILVEILKTIYIFSLDKNILIFSLISLLYSFKFSEKNVLKNILIIIFLSFFRKNLEMFFGMKYVENAGIGIIFFLIIRQIIENFLFFKKENET
ncbi:hypothetical protein EV215_1520 [Hypnocyclicus thermotrophus]|uniref:Uncharacterized protein n=1 Tax=Hypnocyclicus thermotrophus TaxID=1627895 RepID=A0AA46DY17_9FUSO|nr:hypothetical protein [Hypnocyclicus thermotrophus]TDT69178.1 hypothetical protein EV215_1520 [Hypnocyclicus thermotrophus]